MAKPLISDELWQLIEPLMPRRPAARGGRPPVGDREVLIGILFVLRSGMPWDELPDELGCGSGMTCLRRLRDWQRAGIWPKIQSVIEANCTMARRVDWSRAEETRVRLPAREQSQPAEVSAQTQMLLSQSIVPPTSTDPSMP